MEQKIYVGSGRKVEKYDIVNITICLDDKIKPHIYDFNGKKYLNLTVAAKKEADQYGKTHYVAINEYKPEKKEVQNNESEKDSNEPPF